MRDTDDFNAIVDKYAELHRDREWFREATFERLKRVYMDAFNARGYSDEQIGPAVRSALRIWAGKADPEVAALDGIDTTLDRRQRQDRDTTELIDRLRASGELDKL